MINDTIINLSISNYSVGGFNRLPSDQEVIEMAIGHIRQDIALLSVFLYGAVIVLGSLIIYNNWQRLKKDTIPFFSKRHLKEYGFDYIIVCLMLFASYSAFNGIKFWLGL